MNALTLTPRQAFEVARLLDRAGEGVVYVRGGVVTVLLDVYGTGSPNVALELDAAGEVVAKQVLSLRRNDAEDDLDDLGEEQPLPPPVDVSHARPAKLCDCDEPWGDDGTCGICGHTLAVVAGLR